MAELPRSYQVTVQVPPANDRGEWEFTDSVGDHMTVTAQPDFGRVTVYVREYRTSSEETFVWFLPATARDMAAALLAAADVVEHVA